jgi:hypothetical protein
MSTDFNLLNTNNNVRTSTLKHTLSSE